MFCLIRRTVSGLFAGTVATGAMTLWMLWANRRIPTPKKEALPPEVITAEIAGTVGAEELQHPPQRQIVSLVNHFTYGAMLAIPFVWLNRLLPNARKGIRYGLLVWFGHYFGLLPALKMYPPASQKPRMNFIMVIAHIIWGGVLGGLSRRMAPL